MGGPDRAGLDGDVDEVAAVCPPNVGFKAKHARISKRSSSRPSAKEHIAFIMLDSMPSALPCLGKHTQDTVTRKERTDRVV